MSRAYNSPHSTASGAFLLTVPEQLVSGLTVMGLTSGQAQPDWEPLRIDDRVDFGREAAAGATETVISIPLFAVAACW